MQNRHTFKIGYCDDQKNMRQMFENNIKFASKYRAKMKGPDAKDVHAHIHGTIHTASESFLKEIQEGTFNYDLIVSDNQMDSILYGTDFLKIMSLTPEQIDAELEALAKGKPLTVLSETQVNALQKAPFEFDLKKLFENLKTIKKPKLLMCSADDGFKDETYNALKIKRLTGDIAKMPGPAKFIEQVNELFGKTPTIVLAPPKKKTTLKVKPPKQLLGSAVSPATSDISTASPASSASVSASPSSSSPGTLQASFSWSGGGVLSSPEASIVSASPSPAGLPTSFSFNFNVPKHHFPLVDRERKPSLLEPELSQPSSESPVTNQSTSPETPTTGASSPGSARSTAASALSKLSIVTKGITTGGKRKETPPPVLEGTLKSPKK